MKQLYLFLFGVFILACTTDKRQHKTAGKNETGYELVKDWPQQVPGGKLGNPTGLGMDSNQRIFVFRRSYREWPLIGPMPTTYITDNTILLLDSETGKTISSWGANLFIMPHGLTVDAQDNVWVTDVALHQVFKFTHEGKLLMKVGEARVPGNDTAHFNQPTDVAVTKDGSFYVTDGYKNSRVVKFSPEGKYIFEWGKKGKGEAAFTVPHAICLDKKENVYVADRENSRIEVFDQNGRFKEQWANRNFGRICSVTFDASNNTIIAVDDDISWLGLQHNGSDVIIFDLEGNVVKRFGRTGLYNGPKCWYHDVVTDKQGNIFVADILGNTLQRFKKTGSS